MRFQIFIYSNSLRSLQILTYFTEVYWSRFTQVKPKPTFKCAKAPTPSPFNFFAFTNSHRHLNLTSNVQKYQPSPSNFFTFTNSHRHVHYALCGCTLKTFLSWHLNLYSLTSSPSNTLLLGCLLLYFLAVTLLFGCFQTTFYDSAGLRPNTKLCLGENVNWNVTKEKFFRIEFFLKSSRLFWRNFYNEKL